MKKLMIILAFLVLIPLSGCVTVNFNSGAYMVTAKGPVITRSFDLDEYNALNVSGDFDIVYRNGSEYAAELEMQESIFEYLKIDITDRVLYVGTGGMMFTYGNGNKPKLYITAPTIERIRVYGASTIKDSDLIRGSKFDIEVSGACDATLEIDVTDFYANLSGAGNLNLSGRAENADIGISGAGNVEALGLHVKNAEISMSGAGNGSITCSEQLDVEISGVGSFRYGGDPNVRSNVSGFGSVKRAG